eukprot:10539173-Lingulodinium_polyedra.AAC.1
MVYCAAPQDSPMLASPSSFPGPHAPHASPHATPNSSSTSSAHDKPGDANLAPRARCAHLPPKLCPTSP